MPLARKIFIVVTSTVTILIWYLFVIIETEESHHRYRLDLPVESDGRVHWHQPPENFPVKRFIQLPKTTIPPKAIPKIQHDFARESASDRKERVHRQGAVKEAFLHAWRGYKEHAWLKDEVLPLSGKYANTFSGWAATLVDTLDTLLIMGLHDEFEIALTAVEQIDFTTTEDMTVNIFETTIRYIGGFLGAYDLTEGRHPILLQKAQEIGDFVYGAFDTPNRMQVSRWDWRQYLKGIPQRPAHNTLLAELGSLSLEFTRLTQLTGDPKYYDAVQRVTDNLQRAQSQTSVPGLWPTMVDMDKLFFHGNQFTLGGMADSTYEYLPKEHILLGGRTEQYKRIYESAVDAIKKHLLFRPMNEHNADILFSGTLVDSVLRYEAQHLSCFVGGMFGIGAKIFDRPEDLVTARKLVDACIWAYDAMETGLMPEIFKLSPCDSLEKCTWDEAKWLADVSKLSHAGTDQDFLRKIVADEHLAPGMTRITDAKYILRPEAIESVYVMYRITGDTTLQDAAWRMFTRIENMTRTKIAHAGVSDVRLLNTHQLDRMESFWLAETLKYFYLIFSDPDVVSLDDYVYNTEAHPFKRPT